MPKFLLKLTLFFVPVLTIFIFPLFVYWMADEFISVQSVLSSQSKNKEVLFGLAYNDVGKTYKEALIAERDPAIIALGASRVLGFRESFFNPTTSFTNGGRIVGNISISGVDELSEFIKQLPASSHLRVIILSLDPWMYTRDQAHSIVHEPVSTSERIVALFAGRWRTVFEDYFSGKFSLSEIASSKKKSHNIGLTALLDQNGMLEDGSYFYGKEIKNPRYKEDSKGLIAMKLEGISHARTSPELEYGTRISEDNMTSLRNFLELCKKKGIYIIGFTPPFPHSVYQALMSANDPHSQTATRLSQELRDMMHSFDYAFFDFADAGSVGIQDTEFADVAHTTDKGTLRMLIDMAEHDTTLASYVSLHTLHSMLNEATSSDFILTQLL